MMTKLVPTPPTEVGLRFFWPGPDGVGSENLTEIGSDLEICRMKKESMETTSREQKGDPANEFGPLRTIV